MKVRHLFMALVLWYLVWMMLETRNSYYQQLFDSGHLAVTPEPVFPRSLLSTINLI